LNVPSLVQSPPTNIVPDVLQVKVFPEDIKIFPVDVN
jgi:hypothetical protein